MHDYRNTIEAYLLWVEQWRWQRGGNNLPDDRKREVLTKIYEGRRLLAIHRVTRIAKGTITRLFDSLTQFLEGQSLEMRPKCACGRAVWHRGICPEWDTYHTAAHQKGKLTQRNQAQLRHADAFFQNLEHARTMTTIEEQPVTTQQNATKFLSLIQHGINAWTEAGKLLVSMLESDPLTRETILETCPDVTPEILSRFEAIGRGQLHPKTLLNNSPGMRRLRLLPFSEQSRYISEPVPLLLVKGEGVDTLRVSVKDLTAQQALQAFSTNGVRTPEAQRAWLESRKTKRIAPSTPYQIKGHKVLFRADCEMTARELAQVLAQLS